MAVNQVLRLAKNKMSCNTKMFGGGMTEPAMKKKRSKGMAGGGKSTKYMSRGGKS